MNTKGTNFDPESVSTRLNIPIPSLYRYINNLLESGVLIRPTRGQYLPHPTFLRSLEAFSSHDVLSTIARPVMKTLSTKVDATLHFGVLEAEMVTYLVKVENQREELFTKEGQQLEAYCSAIGKVLLAGLDEDALTRYLAAGDFPRLTAKTLTTIDAITNEINLTRDRGYGIDDREIHEGLVCIAVPVITKKGETIGALSAASMSVGLATEHIDETLPQLRLYAQKIGDLL